MDMFLIHYLYAAAVGWHLNSAWIGISHEPSYINLQA